MIIETGHFALVLALVLSLVQAVIPMLGAHYKRAGWMAMARPAAGSLFGLASVAFIALIHSYALSDFSVMAVAENSHTMMPLIYKIAASWGGHEGSMLLWVWMLAFWGFLVARRAKGLSPEFLSRVLSLQALLFFGFTLFILFASNPFLRLDPPAPQGMGFNPVLQDPALALHPPLLYAGYVGFSIAFCFAMAALIGNEVTQEFARRVRPWALAAFAALTAGIAAGSFWAYYELGWGGFWFWDPVENASLMPWLSGAALLHALSALEKRDALKGWTLFLAIVAFSFSLLGTFLVRSGVLTSVHSFALDPARGVFILVLLALAVGGAFLLYALRAPRVQAGAGFGAVSRETMIVLNNVFLFAFCVTVCTGTLYPVILAALDLGSISVGPPYYSAVLLPLFAPFALLMGAAPYIGWGMGDVRAAGRKMVVPFVLTALLLFLPLAHKPYAFLGFACGGWVLFATLHDLFRRRQRMPLSYYGMIIAHAGFALLVLGATAATQGREERILMMSPGDRVQAGGHTFAFLGVEMGLGPDYNVEQGVFSVQPGSDADYFFMTPERRWYPVAQQETTEAALAVTGGGILYAVLGDADGKDAHRRAVRIYYHPLVWLVFGGGALMALGGVLAALERRRAHA